MMRLSKSPTKPSIAEQILRAAADGIRRRKELSDIAMKAARPGLNKEDIE
jgi:hypothetical protein